ncbi:TPA: hypothetical protein N0F65_003536 [Lagenidium giganteum]|uniref:Uncharacterized protein n=1 Tax=Lagenidium giganteum TaxID=4803 RepID=A0AAV2Z4W5_9STRA|nr:TPA: hypothetical protein N0F65_003536 [Lagenidium giganteum]
MGVVVPEDDELTMFTAFVHVLGREFKLRITGIQYNDDGDAQQMKCDGASVEMEAALAAILADHMDAVRVRLLQATSMTHLLTELQDLLSVCLPPQVASAQGKPPAYYERLVTELEQVGWHRVHELSDDLTSVELQVHDAARRVHAIRVTLPSNYPLQAPQCGADAPEEFELVWQARFSLSQILEQFEEFLAKFQAFWNELDDIDKNCCVLEPQRPTRATGRRRIALQRYASVQIELDPNQARKGCELSFFGQEATVSALRERWNEHMHDWDEELSVRENLEQLLQLRFPLPTPTSKDEFAVECGICYNYRLGQEDQQQEVNDFQIVKTTDDRSKIPDRLCENTSCNRPFHEKCLFDWLKALPNARQSFNTVFGECPYCREALSAKYMA